MADNGIHITQKGVNRNKNDFAPKVRMLGLPASVKAPTLEANVGRAVVQLLAPSTSNQISNQDNSSWRRLKRKDLLICITVDKTLEESSMEISSESARPRTVNI